MSKGSNRADRVFELGGRRELLRLGLGLSSRGAAVFVPRLLLLSERIAEAV